jgi:hypothetical protein
VADATGVPELAAFKPIGSWDPVRLMIRPGRGGFCCGETGLTDALRSPLIHNFSRLGYP